MWIHTSEMCFSMKQYPVVCNNVAYDANSDDEVARADDVLYSSEELPHLSAALDDKQRETDCKPKALLTSHFYSICHINRDW